MKGWPEGHSKTGGRSSRDGGDRAGIFQELCQGHRTPNH